MSPPSERYSIDKIEAQHQQEQNNAVKPQQKDGPYVLNERKFCGQSHEAARTQCPAWGKTCNYCKGRNHFEVKCKKVNLLSAGRDSDECDGQWLAVVGADHKRVTALMQVNGCEVRFQLDSFRCCCKYNTPEICKEISSEIHLTEIDYVEQIKGDSPWTSYFGNLEL